MKKLLSILTFLFIGYFGFCLSDTASHDVTINITEVVLLGLNNTSTVTLFTSAPTNAGDDVVGSSDSSKELRYTSLVAPGITRNITANYGTSDSTPSGVSLLLEVSSIPTNCGSAAAQITVDSTAKNIITGIGSCATTTLDGATLTYTLNILDINLLNDTDTSTVTITLTLTDAS